MAATRNSVEIKKVTASSRSLIRRIRFNRPPLCFGVTRYVIDGEYDEQVFRRWVTPNIIKAPSNRFTVEGDATAKADHLRHPVIPERVLRPGKRCLAQLSLLVTSSTVSPIMRMLLGEDGKEVFPGLENQIAYRDAKLLRVTLRHQATLPSEHFYDSILRTIAHNQQPFPIRFNRPFAASGKKGAFRLGFNIACPQLMEVERMMTLAIDEKFTGHQKERKLAGSSPARAKKEFRPALTALNGLSGELASKLRNHFDIWLGSGASGKEMAVGLEVVYQWSALPPVTASHEKPSIDAIKESGQKRVEKRFMFTKEAGDRMDKVRDEDFWKSVGEKYRQDLNVKLTS
ncbi:unnamed protein product [Diplocarpon coronariae]|uniref:Uncharacterized protein n=1 Tax=Diplocarpon coronariae TaxID=2795749 RepID=A0A218ZCY4_9HELO|nr:hypothetical protein B2J93_586 [Marssonina coronariae]